MDDTDYDIQQLSMESFRLDTYDATLRDVKKQLAKAGFYYTRISLKVKCFSCSYELDVSEINPTVDIIKLHKEKQPGCRFAKTLRPNPASNARSKKFLSYDCLRYEKERLETFIEWPILWFSPDDLAADGFYYLRTKDHCACVFCRGIIGAWELDDTPRGEHQRHFPHCPFIQGLPVGNVPKIQSSILDKLTLDEEECPRRCEYQVPEKSSNINYDDISLRQYTGPKRKDYITKDSRVKSYSRWPERVVQKPEEMAEAGFFYCGLSDHVKCFHCGIGLRNWEIDAIPWEEHVRWYPDCNFVRLSKGQEFIDKVRRERPPYLRNAAAKPQKVAASSRQFKPIGDKDLEPLMNLDVKDEARQNDKIHKLHNRIKKFWPKPYSPIQRPSHARASTRSTVPDLTGIVNAVTAAFQEHKQLQRNFSTAATKDKPQKVATSSGQFKPIGDKDLEPLMNLDIIQAVSGMGFPTATIRKALHRKLEQTGLPFFSVELCVEAVLQVREEEMRQTFQEPTDTDVEDETVVRQNDKMQKLHLDYETSSTNATSTSNGAAGPSQGGAAVKSAPPNNVLTIQSNASATAQQTTASTSTIARASTSYTVPETLEGQTSSDVKMAFVSATQLTQKEIADELERIRESRTCKICMDAEMDVVFLPCTHMASCSSCAVTLATCPICRVDIKYTIKPIYS